MLRFAKFKKFRGYTNNKQDLSTASKIIKVNIVGFIVTCEKLADFEKKKRNFAVPSVCGIKYRSDMNFVLP